LDRLPPVVVFGPRAGFLHLFFPTYSLAQAIRWRVAFEVEVDFGVFAIVAGQEEGAALAHQRLDS
jgi:hypothetical protein